MNRNFGELAIYFSGDEIRVMRKALAAYRERNGTMTNNPTDLQAALRKACEDAAVVGQVDDVLAGVILKLKGAPR